MASLTQWTWVWPSSGSWWRKGKPGVLQSMGSQRVRHDWVTDHQQQQDYEVAIASRSFAADGGAQILGFLGSSLEINSYWGRGRGLGSGEVSPRCSQWLQRQLPSWEGLSVLSWVVDPEQAFIALDQELDVSFGTSMAVQWLKLHSPNAGGPGQAVRSHMPQLKIPYVAAKTWCSQINK